MRGPDGDAALDATSVSFESSSVLCVAFANATHFGATFLFAETDRIDCVHWRGRWIGEQTVENYVQELPALLVQAEVEGRLSPPRAELVRDLAAVTGLILEHCPARAGAGVNKCGERPVGRRQRRRGDVDGGGAGAREERRAAVHRDQALAYTLR